MRSVNRRAVIVRPRVGTSGRARRALLSATHFSAETHTVRTLTWGRTRKVARTVVMGDSTLAGLRRSIQRRSGCVGRWCMNICNLLNSVRFLIYRKSANLLISLVFLYSCTNAAG